MYISTIYALIVSKSEYFLNPPTQSFAYVIYEWFLRERARQIIEEREREAQEEREKQEEIERKLQKVSILGVESLLPFGAWLFLECIHISNLEYLIKVGNSVLKFIEFLK